MNNLSETVDIPTESTNVNPGWFRELQNRRVIRVGAVYLVVAWGVLQVAEVVLQALQLPDWALSLVLALLALGLPVALVLGWVYQLTPEGLRYDHGEESAATATGGIGRTVDFVIIGVLTVAASYFGYHYFANTRSPGPDLLTSAPSIAVLPFVNLSGDPDNEFFSDGLAEELLNVLARIPELKVAGRTSSFFFKGKDMDLRVVGEQLGVNTVLEGSVRKQGDNVRVTAQLINARDGFHLWSSTYDQTLDDIFEVQDTIAAAVAGALKVKLLGDQPTSVKTHQPSADAHIDYMQGRYELHRRREASIVRATELFSRAVAADASHAPAWVGLAESYVLQHTNHQLLPLAEAIAKADDALTRALELDPESGEAFAALGLTRMTEAKDPHAAGRAFRRAVDLSPRHSEAWHWFGLLDLRAGRIEDAHRKLARAVELDPLHPAARANLGKALLMSGDLDGAEAHARRSMEIQPDFHANFGMLSGIAATRAMPRTDEALALIDQWLEADPTSLDALISRVGVLLELGRYEDAVVATERMRALRPDHPLTVYGVTTVLLNAGRQEEVAQYLQETVAGTDLGNWGLMLEGLERYFNGDPEGALRKFVELDPGYAGPTPSPMLETQRVAPLVATVYREVGQADTAAALLAHLEQSLATRPRFGPAGYHLLDVEIAAQRGDTQLALALLEGAFADGYRNRLVDGIWYLEDCPQLSGLHEEPRFQAVAQQIREYQREMAQRVSTR